MDPDRDDRKQTAMKSGRVPETSLNRSKRR
jgi:hypothetical protein